MKATTTTLTRTRSQMYLLKSAGVMALLFIVAVPDIASAGPSEWMISSRHGECHDINRTLRHKFDDLPSVASPDEFADVMRRRGEHVNQRPQSADAVIVELPERNISLIFVRSALCDGMIER